METETQTVAATSLPPASTEVRGSLQRVRAAISALRCPGAWARTAGRHVLVGLFDDEPFARLTPMPAGAFGLSFRSCDPAEGWAPMLLVDDLAEVVAHALVGADAIPI
jgi:hypothetical protein